MAGTQPQSISIKELSSAVNRAVAAAVQKHPNFKGSERGAGTIVHPWRPVIIGLVLRHPDPIWTVGEVTAFAAEVTARLKGDAKAVGAGAGPLEPVVYSEGGHTTVGFVPPIPIVFIE